MGTEKNSIHHWFLFTLAHYEETYEQGATTGELFDYSEQVFNDKDQVYGAGSSIYLDKGLVDRENVGDDGQEKYRYTINDEGIRVLRHLSIPRKLPGKDREMDEKVIEAMGMPDFVEEAELEHPEPDESEDETRSTGRFSSEKERRRWFAMQEEERYRQWLQNEWSEENRLREEGEVTFEGLEEAKEDFLGDEEEESEQIEMEEFTRDVPLEDEEDESPEIDLVEFDSPVRRDEDTYEPDMPETISAEPNWERLAVELLKRGLPGLAAKALNKKYSPMEVMYDIDSIIREMEVKETSIDGVEINEDTIYEFFEATRADKDEKEVAAA